MASWIKIENFQCPGKDCPTKAVGKTWVCAKDKTNVYMSQTGYIRCDKVKDFLAFSDSKKFAHYDKICNWSWDCGFHGDHPLERFKKTDKQNFILSMSMALQMVRTRGKAKWIAALILELGEQFGEDDDDSDDDQK